MPDLQPLLTPAFVPGRRLNPAIYSVRVGFMGSFLGGPIAAVIIALCNSWRLGRLRRDWPLGLAGVALTFALAAAAAHGGLPSVFGAEGAYFTFELAGLACFIGVYRVHRVYYRGMSVLGIKAPNGWAVGLPAVILGQGAIAGLLGLLTP